MEAVFFTKRGPKVCNFNSTDDPEYQHLLKEVEKNMEDEKKYEKYFAGTIIGFITFMTFNDIFNFDINTYKNLFPILTYYEYLSPVLYYLQCQ